MDQRVDEIEKLREDNQIMKKALRFYADSGPFLFEPTDADDLLKGIE